jgi:hypothetical protein
LKQYQAFPITPAFHRIKAFFCTLKHGFLGILLEGSAKLSVFTHIEPLCFHRNGATPFAG